MRIIAGKFKGRRLKSVTVSDVRPTSDRVKESIFRIFGDRIVDADFLDLCAGTGNIGLEALSRDARSVTFLDKNRHCIRMIDANLQQCGLDRKHPQVQLINLDVRTGLDRLGKRGLKFDLIYFDPPYESGLYQCCLERIAGARLLTSPGSIVVEHRKVRAQDPPVLAQVDGLTLTRQKLYSSTVISFYEWEENC